MNGTATDFDVIGMDEAGADAHGYSFGHDLDASESDISEWRSVGNMSYVNISLITGDSPKHL